MKTINEILKKTDSKLAKLIKKTKGAEDLEHIFRASLDSNLIKYCHFANYKNSVLTVTVKNTSWATKLRYSIPDIVKTLKVQPEFKDISTIRYVVDKPTPKAKVKKSKTKLSTENEILWQKTLAELTRMSS